MTLIDLNGVPVDVSSSSMCCWTSFTRPISRRTCCGIVQRILVMPLWVLVEVLVVNMQVQLLLLLQVKFTILGLQVLQMVLQATTLMELKVIFHLFH